MTRWIAATLFSLSLTDALSAQTEALMDRGWGGGLGVGTQGPLFIEAHANHLWTVEKAYRQGPLHGFGPEAALGAYFDRPFVWGQRAGLRYVVVPGRFLGLSVVAGLENLTTRFSLDDTRNYVQVGIHLPGWLSVEVGHGWPLTGTPMLVTPDRFLVRLDFNELGGSSRAVPMM